MSKYTVEMKDNVVANIENVHSIDVEGGVIFFRDIYEKTLFVVAEKYFAWAEKVQDEIEPKEVCSG